MSTTMTFTERAESPPTWARRPEKIRPAHLERRAVIYVRQSTPQQVRDHQESTRLQYSLQDRAIGFGWPETRVVVIDDDLGKSGANAEGRAGFQRLVSDVGLGHVGLILGVEMSRLARSCKDWYQLLEICALFGTLIADLDGVYDPAHYNDRLLLGLKGTMSEAELHLLKQRMYQGRLTKARRGDLAIVLPLGYVRRPSGEVALEPDEQAQRVVRLIFQKFEELGTLNAVLQYLVRHDVQVGMRARSGPAKGELEWHRPNRMTLQNVLHNPIYAGAYVYGRRQVDPRHKRPGRPGTGRRVVGREDWQVLLKDRLPAYITWAQYEQNVARLWANRALATTPGAPRAGAALLAGLLVCGKCGHRLSVRYSGQHNRPTYWCSRMLETYGGEYCQSLAARGVDAFVTAQVLAALAPAALELSLEAATNLQRERDETRQRWAQRLERAGYEAERAARQYRLVEPENRLVARQLERDWDATLTARRQLQEEFERVERHAPRLLTVAEREAIGQLAEDIPALWAASTTTDADRKEILRQVVDRVVVETQGTSERVRVIIHWVGGPTSAGEAIRPVGKLSQLSYYPQICARLRQWTGEGLGASEIATRLNAEGFRPPKRRATFDRDAVVKILRRLGLAERRSRSQGRPGLGADEWWLPALAREVPMPEITLYNWIGRGWVRAWREATQSGRWILWADAAELTRLRARRARPQGWYTRRRWTDAPTPADAVGELSTPNPEA